MNKAVGKMPREQRCTKPLKGLAQIPNHTGGHIIEELQLSENGGVKKRRKMISRGVQHVQQRTMGVEGQDSEVASGKEDVTHQYDISQQKRVIEQDDSPRDVLALMQCMGVSESTSSDQESPLMEGMLREDGSNERSSQHGQVWSHGGGDEGVNSSNTYVDWISALPVHVWMHILSFLPYRDLGRALCTCRTFHESSSEVWRMACIVTWPEWAAQAETDNIEGKETERWRRVYELLSLRESEQEILVDLVHVQKHQSVVNPSHRGILTEWLCEVAFLWRLESSIVFQAVRFVDLYLSTYKIDVLRRLQIIGLGCLRLAVEQSRKNMSISEEEFEKILNPERYSFMADGAGTAEEVEIETENTRRIVPELMTMTPNSKMYLRSFWYRALRTKIVRSEDMHIYTLAAFLLELSLQDFKCSAIAPSELAASALSLALEYSKIEPWPKPMQAYGSYTLEGLSSTRILLATLQKTLSTDHLRSLWHTYYQKHEYDENSEAWNEVLEVIARQSDAILVLPSLQQAR